MFDALTSLIDAVSAIDQPEQTWPNAHAAIASSFQCSPGAQTSKTYLRPPADTGKVVFQNGGRASEAVSLPSLRVMKSPAAPGVHRSHSDHSLQAMHTSQFVSGKHTIDMGDMYADRLPGVSALLSISGESEKQSNVSRALHASQTHGAMSNRLASGARSTGGMRGVRVCVSRMPEPSSMSHASSEPSSGNASATGNYSFVTRVHDPCAAGAKPKIPRKRISAEQTNTLQTLFDGGLHFPSREMRDRLARQLGLNSRTIQVWFQNRRQAARNKVRGDERPPSSQRLAIRWMKPVVFSETAHALCTGTCVHASTIVAVQPSGYYKSGGIFPSTPASLAAAQSPGCCGFGNVLPSSIPLLLPKSECHRSACARTAGNSLECMTDELSEMTSDATALTDESSKLSSNLDSDQ